MTELEKLARAKMYMDKLADGIDPITDTELPSDSALNNVRLSRCFFYISDVLRQVIDNGGTEKRAKRPKPGDFQVPDGALERFSYSAQPVSISVIVSQLNTLCETDGMKKLTSTVITDWLLENGFLEVQEYHTGKKTRQPTKQGEYIGITAESRTGQYGDYNLVLYSEDAQRFIIDNFDAILAARKREKTLVTQPESE